MTCSSADRKQCFVRQDPHTFKGFLAHPFPGKVETPYLRRFQMEEDGERESVDVINEEYRVWRKNSPLLYDWVKNYALEWPSLTVQWLPEVTRSATRGNFNVHNLILGTHTSDVNEPNYLMVAEVELPVLDVEVDMRTKEDGSSAFSLNQKLHVKTRILHDGEVNRARYMPQKSVSALILLPPK